MSRMKNFGKQPSWLFWVTGILPVEESRARCPLARQAGSLSSSL
jgi:hypothetical protein